MPKKRDPEKTRALLVDAARREFRGQGYRAASLERILETAGLTKGALYHHFRGKAGLAAAVIDQLARDLRERWDPVAGSADPLSALSAPDEQGVSAWLTLVTLAAERDTLGEELADAVAGAVRDWIGRIESTLAATGTPEEPFASRESSSLIAAILLGASALDKVDPESEHLKRALSSIGPYLRGLPGRHAPPDPSPARSTANEADEEITTDGVSRSVPAPGRFSSFEV